MSDWNNNDLNTPEFVLRPVRQMGPILLDPCSNERSIVKAKIELDIRKGQNGLTTEWSNLVANTNDRGSVFVNPPYGRGHMEYWAQKIALEGVTLNKKFRVETFALVKGDFSTYWWETLRYKGASAICYWRGRIKFLGGLHSAGMFASAMFYYGNRPELFAEVFAPHGDTRVL